MAYKKLDAFFPTSHRSDSSTEENDLEKSKTSYWLEKLYQQGERMRKGKNVRDTQSEVDDRDQALTESGIDENTKNIAIKKEEDTQAVNDLVKKSNSNIISISSAFPWDLFPNTIEVEESKVIFKFNQFLSSQSHSLDIKDISNVFIETSLFFASLQVVSRTFVQNEIKIGKLNKAKAEQVQSIIEGLRTFAENNINTSSYEIKELVLKIGELHSDHGS